jgi:hypothetical protein
MVKGEIGVKEGVWRRETKKRGRGIRKLERMEKAEEVKGVEKGKEKVLKERDGIKEEMKMMKKKKDNLIRKIEGIKKVKKIEMNEIKESGEKKEREIIELRKK